MRDIFIRVQPQILSLLAPSLNVSVAISSCTSFDNLEVLESLAADSNLIACQIQGIKNAFVTSITLAHAPAGTASVPVVPLLDALLLAHPHAWVLVCTSSNEGADEIPESLTTHEGKNDSRFRHVRYDFTAKFELTSVGVVICTYTDCNSGQLAETWMSDVLIAWVTEKMRHNAILRRVCDYRYSLRRIVFLGKHLRTLPNVTTDAGKAARGHSLFEQIILSKQWPMTSLNVNSTNQSELWRGTNSVFYKTKILSSQAVPT
jgi:hypothetical protein